jgi:energy-coupling factor transporter ATP-binding protein EcfA2
VIADEVGAHLDLEARARVLESMREEVKRGLTLIWITQEPTEQAAADHTLILDSADDPGPWAENDAGTAAFEASVHEPPTESPAVILIDILVSPRDGSAGPAILTNQSLRIDIGSRGVWAIEGLNGAGKTVLLEGVAGLKCLPQLKVAWRRDVKHPPILAAQFPRLQQFEERVVEEVTYAALKRGIGRREAIEAAAAAFDALDLGGRSLLERRCWDLSAGESRLMHLVAALITPASVVLLDEPTCGLDRYARG